MSKPSSANAGSCARTPSNPPHERGKSSYHEPKRASTRSTSISYVDDHALPERSPSVAASPSSTVIESFPSNSAPPASPLERPPWPASALRCSPPCHDAMRSTQASIRKHHAPAASTSNTPTHSSLPTAVIGDSCQRDARDGL